MEIIEFLGLSRAGKTTQQKALANVLESEGHRCARPQRPPIRFKDCACLEDFHIKFFDAFRRARDEAETAGYDFIIYDRGFYDRMVLLLADSQRGSISPRFYADMNSAIEAQIPSVAYPFLFKIRPELSLARWEEQRLRGMDNSELCEGLNTMDTLLELLSLDDTYAVVQCSYLIPIINAELPRETITAELNRFIKSEQLVGGIPENGTARNRN